MKKLLFFIFGILISISLYSDPKILKIANFDSDGIKKSEEDISIDGNNSIIYKDSKTGKVTKQIKYSDKSIIEKHIGMYNEYHQRKLFFRKDEKIEYDRTFQGTTFLWRVIGNKIIKERYIDDNLVGTTEISLIFLPNIVTVIETDRKIGTIELWQFRYDQFHNLTSFNYFDGEKFGKSVWLVFGNRLDIYYSEGTKSFLNYVVIYDEKLTNSNFQIFDLPLFLEMNLLLKTFQDTTK